MAEPVGASLEPRPDSGAMRVCVAIVVGLACCIAFWMVTAFVYYIARLGDISDSYLPVGVLFFVLVLVLLVNPVLRRCRASWLMSPRQLALIFGMLLVSAIIPIQGFFHRLPFSLATSCIRINADKQLAEAYEEADLPPSLFPEKLGYGLPTPVSESMVGELLPGEPVPWGSWVGPALSWGAFLFCYGLLMVGLSMIVLPQWRHNERLAFPLLAVQSSLIEAPESGRSLPSVFRSRAFWMGAGVVFTLYLLKGLNAYFPERVPAIPLSWNLQQCFTEEPLIYIPSRMYSNQLYFLFVAIAFFMPTRISFSIWFMMIVYTVYIVVGKAYMPPFHYGTISDHRSGATVTLTLVVLWLGRARWIQVARTLFGSGTSPESRRDRRAALMFVIGMLGLYGWFRWTGVQVGWALLYVAIGFMVCLLITRFIAETGMPFFRIDAMNAEVLVGLVPAHLLGGATTFMAGIATLLFQYASRVSAMTMATHGFALDEEMAGPAGRNGSASRQPRMALLFVGVLVAGLVICGGTILYLTYHNSVTLDGVVSPIGGAHGLGGNHNLVLNWHRGQIPQPLYNRSGHMVFGAVLAGALQWACMAMPTWPLHPIGLLIVYTYYGPIAWASVFLGWLIKVVLVRYGGSHLYRSAKPFFLGIIVGQVFAVAFWCLVAVGLICLGKSYTAIHIQPD